MRLLPKSIHWCRRYPTKFNSGRDIPLRNVLFPAVRLVPVDCHHSPVPSITPATTANLTAKRL